MDTLSMTRLKNYLVVNAHHSRTADAVDPRISPDGSKPTVADLSTPILAVIPVSVGILFMPAPVGVGLITMAHAATFALSRCVRRTDNQNGPDRKRQNQQHFLHFISPRLHSLKSNLLSWSSSVCTPDNRGTPRPSRRFRFVQGTIGVGTFHILNIRMHDQPRGV